MWGSEYKSKQGNIGLVRAIDYFVSNGYAISIPLNDTQPYDLIVDMNDTLYKVSVKTTRYKNKNGNYVVHLKNSGGSSGKSIIRYFDNTTCDLLFVLCENNIIYLFKSKDINSQSSLTLSKNRDVNIVKFSGA